MTTEEEKIFTAEDAIEMFELFGEQDVRTNLPISPQTLLVVAKSYNKLRANEKRLLLENRRLQSKVARLRGMAKLHGAAALQGEEV